MKAIYCFGDSWTRGDGCQFVPGSGIIPSPIKYPSDKNRYSSEFSKFSFPSQLKSMLNDDITVHNCGDSGGSNFNIYRGVLSTLNHNRFNKGDIAIVSWTSIIREPLNFLFADAPNQTNNSIKGYINEHNHKFSPPWLATINNAYPKYVYEELYKDFIVHRINFNFLYEICMNYICNLQIIFEGIGVNYLFINTFEIVTSDKILFYDKIKKDKWLLFDSTLSDYLCDIEETMDLSKGYTIWEDDMVKPGRNLDGPHPNRIGYGHIAKLVSNELINRKLL